MQRNKVPRRRSTFQMLEIWSQAKKRKCKKKRPGWLAKACNFTCFCQPTRLITCARTRSPDKALVSMSHSNLSAVISTNCSTHHARMVPAKRQMNPEESPIGSPTKGHSPKKVKVIPAIKRSDKQNTAGSTRDTTP